MRSVRATQLRRESEAVTRTPLYTVRENSPPRAEATPVMVLPLSPMAMSLQPRAALVPPRAVGASRESERPPRAGATCGSPRAAATLGIKQESAARRSNAF
eukprot:14128454-Alexandrium_andersonii.AAC.1